MAVKLTPEPSSALITSPAEPESVVYIVQRNDTLSKISKKYNIKMAAIYRLNPSLKGDVIRIGQKIKLPAGTEVGEQKAPESAKPASKKAYTPYTGATKEYAVKSGDTLGKIAYGNGINIRQLKELNGLSSDVLRIGQKLLVPADGKAVSEVKKTAETAAKPAAAAKKTESAPAAAAPEIVEPAPAAAVPAEAEVVEPAPAVETAVEPAAVHDTATTSYVVQEGDDMTSVSISWGVSSAQIRELNNLGDNDQLKPGQVIKLPADAQQ